MIVLPKLKYKQQTVAARAAMTAAEFVNERYGAVLHRPRPDKPPRRGPVPKLLWADLLLSLLSFIRIKQCI